MQFKSSCGPGVIITRPIEQSKILAERLQIFGYKIFVSPLLKIVSIPKPLDLSYVQAIVFTSANAARPLRQVRSLCHF